MLDHNAALLALRNRALTLAAPTTGSTSLSATSAGYARAAGSFITDGFLVGMEVTGSGFTESANNTAGLVTAVSALLLTIKGGRTVEAAGGNETVYVGIPEIRVWENLRPEAAGVQQESPTQDRWYVEEDFVPGGHRMVSMPARNGIAEESGLYVLRLYSPENVGPYAMSKVAGEILELFSPGTTLTAGSDTLYVREDVAPRRGQILPQGNGWARCEITVPWRGESTNVIAA